MLLLQYPKVGSQFASLWEFAGTLEQFSCSANIKELTCENPEGVWVKLFFAVLC